MPGVRLPMELQPLEGEEVVLDQRGWFSWIFITAVHVIILPLLPLLLIDAPYYYMNARKRRIVITNRRVLLMWGNVDQGQRVIPLNQVVEATVTRSWWGRRLGYGDLHITAFGLGSMRMWQMKNPYQLRDEILRRKDDARPAAPQESRGPEGGDALRQMEGWAALHAKGQLTDEEFADRKAKILGG